MTHYNDLPEDQKSEVEDLKDYIQTQIPAICEAENIVMRESILDVVLSGSFANGVAVTNTTHANSDLDIIILIKHQGILTDVMYKDGCAPEQTEDQALIAQGEKHVHRVISNFIRTLSKHFPNLDYAVNAVVKGYDNIYPSLYGAKLGLSLIDFEVFDNPSDLWLHHGLQ